MTWERKAFEAGKQAGRDEVSRTVDSFKQQLAETELVVEQMREALNKVASSQCLSSFGEDVEEAVALQPSLSALREHEAKVLADNKASVRLTWLVEHGARVAWTREGEHCRVFKNDGEDDYPVCGWPTFFETGIEAIDAAMASELRAKGE